jgi:integral membrane sensor domain MASE1
VTASTPRLSRRDSWRSASALFAGVGVVYLLGAVLSRHSVGAEVGPALFPPAGLSVAAMLLSRRSRWPVIAAAIVAAEFAVDPYYGAGVLAASGFALSRSVEPLIGASLVRLWCKGEPDLRARVDLAKYIAAACLAGPLVGGLIGGAIGASCNSDSWLLVALHWWVADGIGVLVVGAPILLWSRQSYVLRARPAETAAVLVATGALTLAAVWSQTPPALPLLPVMAWAAFRLDVLGTAMAGAVLGLTINYMTASGYGPFRDFSLPRPLRLTVTQAFIAVVVLLAMLIAQEAAARVAAVNEHQAERRERDRLQILAQLAQLLSAALTPSQIGEVVVRQLFSDAGAQAVSLGLVAPGGGRLEWVTSAGYPQVVHDKVPDGIPLDQLTAATEAVGTGRPVVLASSEEYRRRYPDLADMMALSAAEAMVNWPLTSGAKTVGVLGMMWTRPQLFDAAQLAYISAVAAMVGQALVRARVYADEHARAAVLQAAVLPTEPAEIADLDLAVRYEPADGLHGLGGDWYDVMALPKQRTYLAVGDVVGHGLPAVQDMAQLRSAGRAVALQGLPPARILAELNTFAAHASHGKFATMAVAVFDPVGSVLTYGVAGHPPALLRRSRDGNVVRLDDADGPVLGPMPEANYREGNVGIDPGDILVMYTDGLIERRGRDVESGIAQAQRIMEGWQSDTMLEEGCRQLTETLALPPRQDDVCVMVIRLRAGE